MCIMHTSLTYAKVLKYGYIFIPLLDKRVHLSGHSIYFVVNPKV